MKKTVEIGESMPPGFLGYGPQIITDLEMICRIQPPFLRYSIHSAG
jgi:hypothetical protein